MSTTATIDIPAEWLATGPTLPDRCARHGLPFQERVDFAAKSDPKLSSKRRLFVPGYTAVDRAEEYVTQLKAVQVIGWPLCSQCVRQRQFGLRLAGVLFFGGLGAMVSAFVAGGILAGDQPWLLIPILGGFTAMLLSPLALRYGGLPRLTQARVTSDGRFVQVSQPAASFVEQLRLP